MIFQPRMRSAVTQCDAALAFFATTFHCLLETNQSINQSANHACLIAHIIAAITSASPGTFSKKAMRIAPNMMLAGTVLFSGWASLVPPLFPSLPRMLVPLSLTRPMQIQDLFMPSSCPGTRLLAP